MKIGVLGGSFNPPHLGHKQIVLDLLKNKIIDKAIVIPVGETFNKSNLVNYSHRFKMLELMFNNIKNVEISNYEKTTDVTYTYQTLDYFKNKYPNDLVYFILSTDNVINLPNWKNAEHLLKNHNFIVVDRFKDNYKNVNINLKNNKNILFTNVIGLEVCSTIIREKIKNNEQQFLLNYLSEAVLNYIKNNKLYMQKNPKQN